MGETPLIRAAHNGHFQTVAFLVESGADVNSVDMVGGSVARCSSSVWAGSASRMVPPPLEPLLTSAGTSPAPSSLPACQGDNCALHWAAMRGHVEIVKLLLTQARLSLEQLADLTCCLPRHTLRRPTDSLLCQCSRCRAPTSTCATSRTR